MAGDNHKTQQAKSRMKKSQVDSQEGGKLRRKRGKRGGKKRKREKNNHKDDDAISSPTSSSSNPSTATPSQNRVPTVWKALEIEWFRTGHDDIDKSSSTPKIPEPLPLSLFTDRKKKDNNIIKKEEMNPDNNNFNNESSSLDYHNDYGSLCRLWHKYRSRKHRRQQKKHGNSSRANNDDDDDDYGDNCWKPRPIQLQAWSILMPKNEEMEEEGTNSSSPIFNMIGLSPTASGKTLAFGAPMVVAATKSCQQQQSIEKEATATETATIRKSGSNKNQIFGIVLIPTRELAQQVSKELELMVKSVQYSSSSSQQQQQQEKLPIRIMTAYGGGGGQQSTTQDQINTLRGRSKGECGGSKWIVVATPGRFLDIVEKLSSQQQQQQQSDNNSNNDDQKAEVGEDLLIRPRYICLDECDRLATNTDLAQQVTSILKICILPKQKQKRHYNNNTTTTTLAFFSATYPSKAQTIWNEWMSLTIQQRSCVMVRVDTVSLEKRKKTSTSSSANKKLKREEGVDDDGDNSNCFNASSVEGVVATDLKDGQEVMNDEDESDNANSSSDKQPNSLTSSTTTTASEFLSKIPAHLVQTLHVCAEHKKPKKLITTLDRVRREEKASTTRHKRLGIIFFGRIKTLQYISKLLATNSNHDCLELHSQLPQHVRTRNMNLFKAGKIPILLATEIAARGLHVNNVAFVINYDFPSNLEQYVHRCGRAGRNYNGNGSSNDGDGTNKATTKAVVGLPPTIYSFFTRPLAPMAPDLVALLEASNSWVDPNLRALVPSSSNSDQQKKKKKRGGTSNKANNGNGGAAAQESSKVADPAGSSSCNPDDQEAYSDDDAFPELSATKVVLKRADHVSDASSSSSSSEDDDSEGEES